MYRSLPRLQLIELLLACLKQLQSLLLLLLLLLLRLTIEILHSHIRECRHEHRSLWWQETIRRDSIDLRFCTAKSFRGTTATILRRPL